jgi:hypothetical protein
MDRHDGVHRGMSFRRQYGSSPLHLIGHILAFAAFVWAFRQILGGGYVVNYVAWFVGAAILHDIVLVPVYSLIDRIARRETRHAFGPRINYLRAPAIISAILLLVYSPLILGYSDRNYRADTGHAVQHELRNWLLITAGLFVASGLVFLARHARGWLLSDEARLVAARGQSRPK